MIYINKTGKQNQVWMPKPYDIVINDCPDADDAYNSGYTSGYTDGLEEGYPSGRTDGFEEGYTSGYTDGLNACSGGSCEEEWHDGYDSGYTDGLNACSGGSCEGIWEEGYDSGYTDGQASVDCTDFYNSGKTDGIAEQKAKLTSTAFTSNGTYTRADGWNRVTVNVASGYSKDDLDRAFQSGYTAGLRDCSGFTPAADLTLNVASAITGTGQASVTVTPSEAGTDITYTSSDHSKATIDDNGVITVVGNGNVTFCVIDAITELQDCKTVNVTADSGSGVYLAGMYYVTSTTEPTEILNPHRGTTGLTKMEYPYGYERPLATSFVFPTSGVQTIYFYPKNPQFVGQGYNFHYVKDLIGTEINSGVTEIFGSSYQKTSLMSVEIPAGALLRYSAFTNTPLTSVTINEGVSTIEGASFAFCQFLPSVIIPSTLTVLPDYTFLNCNALSSITFNGNMASFGDGCFKNCTSLRNFVVPASVTGIGASCFEGDEDIESITFLRSTPAPLGNNATSLGSVTYTFPIYVPAGAVEAYKAEYLNYASRIQPIP